MNQTPLEITARGLVLNDWWWDKIQRKMLKLSEFDPRITHCRVVVESPHKHRRKGRPYLVRIDIDSPRGFIVINREPDASLNAAIDRAFDAAERRLEERVRRVQLAVKHHEPQAVGEVTAIYHEGGFGFLESSDGRRIYFHANSVLDGEFDKLTLGSLVEYHEEEGEKGPQASTVTVVRLAPKEPARKHRRRPASARR
jgi:cold shock CspA family protein